MVWRGLKILFTTKRNYYLSRLLSSRNGKKKEHWNWNWIYIIRKKKKKRMQHGNGTRIPPTENNTITIYLYPPLLAVVVVVVERPFIFSIYLAHTHTHRSFWLFTPFWIFFRHGTVWVSEIKTVVTKTNRLYTQRWPPPILVSIDSYCILFPSGGPFRSVLCCVLSFFLLYNRFDFDFLFSIRCSFLFCLAML